MEVQITNSIQILKDKYSFPDKIPLFATQDYADYLLKSENIRTIWFYEEIDGLITFIIPFAVKKNLFYKKGYFLSSVNCIGCECIKREKEFIELVLESIKKNRLCDWIQQQPNWAFSRVAPSNSIKCEYGTYRIDLQNNTELELFRKIKRETRQQICKELRNNIIIKSGNELLEDCFKVIKASASIENRLLPACKIKILLENLTDNIQIYIAYYNSLPQSCVIFYYNKISCYAVYSALIPHQVMGINHLLFWQAIKDARQKGIKYFDFVGARIDPPKGSKNESIQRFKKHFGGEFITGYLWKMPISRTKYKIFNFLINILSISGIKKYPVDIIDQELQRRKMKQIILTIDYELYLGEKTGTVKECMIEPTAKIVSILKKNNSKMTVFWDVLHYYQLLQNEKSFPELKVDRQLIENQLLDLARNGHDIQLHLHPHWLDAQYREGRWIFQYNRFELNKLDKEIILDDINTIAGCVSQSKKLIENLIRRVDPDYKITTFRAGGYLIEPFGKIGTALITNGINIDSSVCPGLYHKNGISSYDFRYYPLKQKYTFTATPGTIVEKGKFIEIPITTIKLSVFRNTYFKILRKIKYNSLEKGRAGLGTGDNNKKQSSKIKKLVSTLFVPQWGQFTTDSNFREKFNYMLKKAPDNSNMIIHPKLLNKHTLGILSEYLSANKIHFVSIKDLIS